MGVANGGDGLALGIDRPDRRTPRCELAARRSVKGHPGRSAGRQVEARYSVSWAVRFFTLGRSEAQKSRADACPRPDNGASPPCEAPVMADPWNAPTRRPSESLLKNLRLNRPCRLALRSTVKAGCTRCVDRIATVDTDKVTSLGRR